MKTISILILGMFLAVSAFSQTPDLYGPKPPQNAKNFVRKFHLAQVLFEPGWNAAQTTLIRKAIANPVPELIPELQLSFAANDFEDAFVKIGMHDIRDYLTVYHAQVLADKKRLVIGLTNAQKWHIWRTHFAYIVATHDLTETQVSFLERLSALMTDELNLKAIHNIGEEGSTVFSKELGYEILGTIGSYTQLGSPCKKTIDTKGPTPNTVGGECNCAEGHYNYGCDNCSGAAACGVVGGCGVLWAFDCTNTCRSGFEEIQ